MASIYETFSRELIQVNDNYKGSILLHKLHNILFQADTTEENNFLSCVAVVDGKIQSLCNRQFFYIPEIVKGYCGHHYSKHLQATYSSIVQSSAESVETITTPVFYFMDYDSTNATGHTYDVLFYLLYMYKSYNLDCPIIIPNSTNTYFRSLIELIRKYHNVTFIELEYGKTYCFQTVFFVRTYMNMFLPEVKDFLNTTLIDPILEKYKNEPYHEKICRLKIKSKDVILKSNVYNTPQAIFDESDEFLKECNDKSIFQLTDEIPEDLKIYYINKANTITVFWGSIYYIYVDYYLKSTEDKFISVLFHKYMMPERQSLIGSTGRIYQQMYHCDRNIPQIYNSLSFQGEVIDNIETLNEYLARSSLFKRNTL